MTTNKIIKNRSEIVFLYDIKDANPNGDPLDENKPRVDEETGINIVTDVRLKRTIRDYLMDFKEHNTKDKDIFIKEVRDDRGYLYDGKRRAKDFNESPEEVLNRCIDVRLFGAVIPLEKDSITYTGPVQFRMGRSLHSVEIKHIKGTGAFADQYPKDEKKRKKQHTFREEDILPYSLICFYGIINENAAKHTSLTENDINLLLESMWNGTKNLITRSKAGQMPRLLLKVNYRESDYHIGDLDKLIKIKDIDKIEQEKLRDISDVAIDASELIETLNKNKDKIESIDLKVDDRVKIDLKGLDKKIQIKEIPIE